MRNPFLTATSFALISLGGSQAAWAEAPSSRPPNPSALSPHAVPADSELDALRTLSLRVPRRGHTITAMADHRLLILGGSDASGCVSAVERLDPASGTADIIGTLSVPRSLHSASLLPDGKLLVAGGTGGSGNLDSTEIFDPETQVFAPGPRLAKARSGHTATVLRDGRVLVAGGAFDGSAEILDLKHGLATPLETRLGGERGMHSAVLLGDGRVLLAGGLGEDAKALNSAEVFDPATGRFKPVWGTMVGRRVRPELRLLPDGKVHVVGGDKGGSLEVFSPKGDYFRGFTGLSAATPDLPGAKRLRSPARALLAQGLMEEVGESRSFTGGRASRGEGSMPAREPGLVGLEPRSADPWDRVSLREALTRLAPLRPLERQGRVASSTYYSVDLPGAKQAVVCPRDPEDGSLVRSLAVLPMSQASLSTDRIDYGPDGEPRLRGDGWAPSEPVQIVRHAVYSGARNVLHVKADEQGRFEYAGLKSADHAIGSYVLTAVGARSGAVAQTVYQSCPPLDPKRANEKPLSFRVSNIPLAGASQGWVQTEQGPMPWKVEPASPTTTRRVPASAEGAPFSAGFSDWVGIGPFDVDLGPVKLQNIQGDMSLAGSFDVDGGIDLGGIFCPSGEVYYVVNCWPWETYTILPSAYVGLDTHADFSAHVGMDLALEPTTLGAHVFTLAPLSTFTVGLDPFKFTSRIDLDAHVQGGITKAMRYHMGAGFDVRDLGMGMHFSSSAPYVSFSPHGSVTGGPDFQVLDLGAAALDLGFHLRIRGSLGDGVIVPRIEADLTPASLVVHGRMDSQGFGTDCASYACEASWGLRSSGQGSFRWGLIAPAPVGYDVSLFQSTPLSQFRLFKDTGAPVLNHVPSHLLLPTEPGLATAVAKYADISAFDACSGIQSLAIMPASGTAFPLGTTPVTVVAKDKAASGAWAGSQTNTTTATFSVTVRDLEPPVLHGVPADIRTSADPGKATAVVTWPAITATDNVGIQNLTVTPPSGTAFPMGTTVVTAVAKDNALVGADPGSQTNVTTRSFSVTVLDQEPPVITGGTASFPVLWPPNHKMRDITIDYTVSDNDRVKETFLTVVSDEPDNGLGDGDTANDIQIVDAHRLRLRAERSGLGTGRTYTVTITAIDPSGNVSRRAVLVRVPLSQ